MAAKAAAATKRGNGSLFEHETQSGKESKQAELQPDLFSLSLSQRGLSFFDMNSAITCSFRQWSPGWLKVHVL